MTTAVLTTFDFLPGEGICVACNRPAKADQLMCSGCWALVTPSTKASVYRALRAYRTGSGTYGDLREVQTRAVIETLR